MDTNQERLKAVLEDVKTLTVVGANWGDEGKGKVIDLVMEHYDIVARFSGGANAGHTVFTPDGQKLVSHLIPCGLAQHKVCVLGRGEFFNLEQFLKELEDSKKVLGDKLSPVYVDRQATLWTPYHHFLEDYIELLRGQKIGTTSKGIGPLEGLYKLRLGPLVGYLFEPELLRQSLERLYKFLLPLVGNSADLPKPETVVEEFSKLSGALKDRVRDTSFYLHDALSQGKKILLEGAQATGLDAWWGTYPYVSSGNSVAAGAALGTGLPVSDFQATILVAKTLPTRVGFGPMPSEMWQRQAAEDFPKAHPELFVPGEDRERFLKESLEKINSGQAASAEMSQYFQILGDERGATTGRGRSVGWLDIPWLAYAIRVNGPKYLALTRFDMLSGLKAIPVVVGYKYQGEVLPPGQLPAPWELERVETVKEVWPGFSENIGGVRDEKALPQTARDFLKKLENLLKTPILLVGTGPGRQDIIVRSGQIG